MQVNKKKMCKIYSSDMFFLWKKMKKKKKFSKQEKPDLQQGFPARLMLTLTKSQLAKVIKS